MSKKSFRYKEIDNQGLKTLQIISDNDNFNTWIYQSIKPFLRGNILEIGSGIGNITQCVINDKLKVTASDIRENYCAILHNRFGENEYLKEIRIIDIVHPGFDQVYADLLNQFDCIFALNIIEHVENDTLALENCKKLLQKDGSLIVLVPAYKFLYNSFDIELKHYRRYTKLSVESLFQRTGFKISKTKYFNFMGIFGWWLSGSMLRFKIIPSSQMRLFNKLVPIFKLVDEILKSKIGLSVIAVGTPNN